MHPDWAFKLDAKKFLKDTRDNLMSASEVGAYCNLLAYAWLQERTGFLPFDDELIRIAADMTPVEWVDSRKYVLCLFSKYDEQYYCPSLAKQGEVIVRKQYPTRFEHGYRPRTPRPPMHRPAIPKQVRQQVLAVGACCLCGSTNKLAVDHIYPYSRGGTNDIENLQCLCTPCNAKKSNKI